MKNLLAFIFVTTVLFACKPENESPVINSLVITNTTILKAENAYLEFSYEFSDDNGLNQFRASVLDDFVDARLQSAPWNYERDFDLTGTSAIDTVQVALPYPDLEPGRYELTITVQDIDGDETVQKQTFNIIE